MSLMIKDKTGEIVKVAGNSGGGASDADKVKYDNVTSGLEATNVQSAVDELAENKADKTEISSVVKAPQTAEVGQILAVKAVDDAGKPTEWECVEKGGGSGGGFLYENIILPETKIYNNQSYTLVKSIAIPPHTIVLTDLFRTNAYYFIVDIRDLGGIERLPIYNTINGSQIIVGYINPLDVSVDLNICYSSTSSTGNPTVSPGNVVLLSF